MQKRLNDKKRTSWGKWMIVLLLLFFFLFLFFRFFRARNPGQIKTTGNLASDSVLIVPEIPDSSLSVSNGLEPKDSSLIDSLINRSDTLAKKKIKKVSVTPVKRDTIVQQNRFEKDSVAADSISDSTDSIILATDLCREDTSALWVYPDPSGGLHRKSISINLIANKDCQIRYRIAGEQNWTTYQGESITIDSTATLQFDATDSCGTHMEMREEYYEIELSNVESPCPPGMEFVKISSSKFCMDRYEWPNHKGVIPKAYISLYQAMDSCYSVGKRLCTSEEWMLACSGPHTWSYPYGQKYERYACATHDKKVQVSGSRPECRSFFGVHDMSGSLLEWTSTKAVNNRQFFYVMGGFWESGPQSGCSDKRYSYYPENKHNPVGFRCCTDVPDHSDSGVMKIQKGSGR